MTSSLDEYPQRDGLYCILTDGIAVYNRYQNRVIVLDGLSSELWLRADGKTSLRTIAQDIAGWTKQPVETLSLTVPMVLTILSSEGLMYQLSHPAPIPYHLSLPQEEQDVERMRESMVEAGWIDE
jgi:hypothetical protein